MNWTAVTTLDNVIVNPTIAVDDAIVCALLFSRVPKGPPLIRLRVEMNAKPKSVAHDGRFATLHLMGRPQGTRRH